MPDNFDYLKNNKYEVGSIRNLLVSARVNADRKEFTPIFHVVYALVCSLIMYLATDGISLGLPVMVTLVFTFVFPPLCAVTFLYGTSKAKILPVMLPLILFAARLMIMGQSKETLVLSLSNLFTYLLCILCAAILTKSVVSGYTKNTVFVALTVCYAVIFICQIAYVSIYLTGSFGLSTISDSAKSIFDSAAESVISYTGSEEGSLQMKLLLNTEAELSAAQLETAIRQLFETTFNLIKALLPALFVITCMFYSFITVGLFSVVANIFHINVFVCIMDLKWSYRPSMLSTKVYDIVCVAFVLSMFIDFPASVSVAIINTLIILSPLMFAASMRCIYQFLFGKFKNKVAAIATLAGGLLFSMLFLGPMIMFFISAVGVSLIRARDREEKQIVPIKMASDTELYNSAFATHPDNKDDKSDDGDNENQ